jgi:hypothetical protein
VSDNDFTYIDEHEECDDISSDAIDKRVPKVNKDGKKVRGKDIEWRDVKVFADVEEFQESEIKKEIDEEFSENGIMTGNMVMSTTMCLNLVVELDSSHVREKLKLSSCPTVQKFMSLTMMLTNMKLTPTTWTPLLVLDGLLKQIMLSTSCLKLIITDLNSSLELLETKISLMEDQSHL